MENSISTLLEELDTELKGSILPFWMSRMVDKENAGFYGRIDGRDRLYPDADKGGVLNARILWTFSAAYNYYGNKDYLDIAVRAFDYCMNYFINEDCDGVYWLLDYKGKPVDTKNQIYALGFMIYGMSEYFISTNDEKALNMAIRLFHSIEKFSYDPDLEGYYEAFDQNWELLEDMRLSDKDANEKKTMNTHLHILEGYTNLYRIWKDDRLRTQLRKLIEVFYDHIIDHQSFHFKLFFDEKWQERDHEISFGHDIEGSWLIQEACEVLGDTDLIKKSKEIAIRMVNEVIKNGFDEDGGLFYEAYDQYNLKDDDKHWWPHAEAIVGLINVFQITSDKEYLKHAIKVWNFTKDKIIDKEGGEWYFKISRQGDPYFDEDKAGFWKCPYHNSRACLEVIRRLNNNVL